MSRAKEIFIIVLMLALGVALWKIWADRQRIRDFESQPKILSVSCGTDDGYETNVAEELDHAD